MASSQATAKGQGVSIPMEPKARGANRSTKVAGKLKVLPDQPEPLVPVDKLEPPPPPRKPEGETTSAVEESDEDDGDDEAGGDDTEEIEVRVPSLVRPVRLTDVRHTLHPDLQPAGPHPGWDCTSRRAAPNKEESKAASSRHRIRDCLVRRTNPPRPSASLTTRRRSYRFSELMRFFNARRATYHTNPRTIDEAIYTPYVYDPPNLRHVHFNHAQRATSSGSDTATPTQTGDLLGVPELVGDGTAEPEHESQALLTPDPDVNGVARHKKKSKFEEVPTVAEIFMFEYGTVVIWGMTEAEEKRFLSSM